MAAILGGLVVLYAGMFLMYFVPYSFPVAFPATVAGIIWLAERADAPRTE